METAEEINKIQEELSKTPYNKATEKHIGLLKAKLAKLKAKQGKKAGGGVGYGIRKRGDATVLLVGFPSVGKSTLLNRITAAQSKIGEYDFTTVDVVPGMLEYKGAKIQILDVPGLIKGGAAGKGRGKTVLSVVRSADLVLMMVDARAPEQLGVILRELHKAGLRLNQSPPDIKIHKKNRGGLQILSTKKLQISQDTIKSVLNELGIYNAEVVIRECIDLDELVDVVAKNLVYVPAVTVINKVDVGGTPKISGVKISALKGMGIPALLEEIWKRLRLIRIYMKKIGKGPDMEEPFIIKKGATILCVCEKIHKELAKELKYARIWGPSAKFAGQNVGLEHILLDKDIIELHRK